jgi:hypothetical protein
MGFLEAPEIAKVVLVKPNSDDRTIFLVQAMNVMDAVVRGDILLQDEVCILSIPRPRDPSKGTLGTP